VKPPPFTAMTDALQLIKTGKLLEATSLIQARLSGSFEKPSAQPPASTQGVDLKGLRPLNARVVGIGNWSHQAESTGVSQGKFETRSYSGAGTKLSYRVYRPADFTASMPLVVMLHGCTQSPDDFARGTAMNELADELGFVVAYPAQTTSANPQKCWNWFRPGHQQRDRGEPSMIAGITRAVIAAEDIDESRVYIAGLSAGGAAAAIMAAEYPDIYAAVGIHSGLACGAARDLPSAMSAMRTGGVSKARASRFIPVITFHGDKDATVHEANSREIVKAASSVSHTKLDTTIEKGRSAGGRDYTCTRSVDDAGRVVIEQWTVHGAGHAWAGGEVSGTYTDPKGPDASREMVRFFLEHLKAR
jgi:poly(hydroxyalkanoate) depolymerase family esterase